LDREAREGGEQKRAIETRLREGGKKEGEDEAVHPREGGCRNNELS